LLQWYDDLPGDPVEAFIYLEELFRNLFLTEPRRQLRADIFANFRATIP
jgi:hypothetical protein